MRSRGDSGCRISSEFVVTRISLNGCSPHRLDVVGLFSCSLTGSSHFCVPFLHRFEGIAEAHSTNAARIRLPCRIRRGGFDPHSVANKLIFLSTASHHKALLVQVPYVVRVNIITCDASAETFELFVQAFFAFTASTRCRSIERATVVFIWGRRCRDRAV